MKNSSGDGRLGQPSQPGEVRLNSDDQHRRPDDSGASAQERQNATPPIQKQPVPEFRAQPVSPESRRRGATTAFHILTHLLVQHYIKEHGGEKRPAA